MDLILINLIRMIKFINIFKIFIVLLFLSNTTLAHNHFPITTDSKMMIKRGKILYEQNCASCHMINLSGAKNWKGVDEDGHRKAPPRISPFGEENGTIKTSNASKYRKILLCILI